MLLYRIPRGLLSLVSVQLPVFSGIGVFSQPPSMCFRNLSAFNYQLDLSLSPFNYIVPCCSMSFLLSFISLLRARYFLLSAYLVFHIQIVTQVLTRNFVTYLNIKFNFFFSHDFLYLNSPENGQSSEFVTLVNVESKVK